MRTKVLAVLLMLMVCRGAWAQAAPAEVVRSVDAVIEQMTRAAGAADKAAFLACLDPREPFFAQEQSAWCDDLVKRGVKSVGFQRTGDVTLEGEAALLPLAVEYTSNTGAAVGGTRAEWPARFVRADGGWRYAGEAWQRKDGDRFWVLYLPGDEAVADMVLEAFPEARATVDEGFGVSPGPQQIKLFRNMAHLKATVYLNQPDQVLMGWNEPGESIKFMRNYATNVRDWTAAFAHEYGHVATWEYGPGMKSAPWWVVEGVAELASESIKPAMRESVNRLISSRAEQGKLTAWEDITDYDTAPAPVKIMAYRQGHHMVGYISEQWGRDGRTRWLKAMGAGKTLDAACREVMGMGFADLDRAWRGTLPSPEPTEEERAAAAVGVAEALRRMEAACLGGDDAAYMENIYEGDSEFVHEQRYFANDMKKKPAHEISLTVGELDLRGDTAAAEMNWVWKMAAEKKERTVKFRASFIRAEDGRWLYAGEVWNRKVAPGAVVMFDDGLEEQAAGALADFAAVREHVELGFNLHDKELPHKTQKIKLYGSMAHLQQSICLSYENGLGGWNEPNESIKLLVRAGGRRGGLRTVITHEYGHVATFELGPTSNSMPWWILEGVADLAAEKISGRQSQFIERAARRGTLQKWEDLADFETVPPRIQAYVYQQGHHMLGYISDRWGKDPRVQWLTAMSNGRTLDEATREVFGLSFEDLDRDWRASLPAPEPQPEEAAEPVGAGG